MSVVTFNERVKGWSAFHTYSPEGMVGLNANFYSFKNGQLYLHNVASAPKNTFYGLSSPSKISISFNEDLKTTKVLQSISLHGSDPWEVLIQAYINNVDNSIDSSITSVEFVEKEGIWHAYTRRGETETVDTKAAYGIGQVLNIDGNDVTIAIKPNQLSEGDMVLRFVDSVTADIGIIQSVSQNTLTLDSVAGLNVGDFILGLKDSRIEGSPLRGYTMRIDLESDNYENKIELFSVGLDVVKSFM